MDKITIDFSKVEFWFYTIRPLIRDANAIKFQFGTGCHEPSYDWKLVVMIREDGVKLEFDGNILKLHVVAVTMKASSYILDDQVMLGATEKKITIRLGYSCVGVRENLPLSISRTALDLRHLMSSKRFECK
jgi:hypothetical protein